MTLDGHIMAVASRGFDGLALDSGRIRFYEHAADGSWQLQDHVEGRQQSDRVGDNFRLSADGKTVASGNALHNNDNAFASGVVRVWRKTCSNEWKILGAPIFGKSQDLFGFGVDLSDNGDVVAVYARWSSGIRICTKR